MSDEPLRPDEPESFEDLGDAVEPEAPRPARPKASDITGNKYDGDALMSIDDVAAFLNLPIGSIRKKRNMGRFAPAYKLGKHLRWKGSDVLEWLEDQGDED